MDYNFKAPYDLIIFYDWFLPAYKAGGPIRSIANFIDSLKARHHILVICSNKDLDGSVLNVIPDQMVQANGYDTLYLSKNKRKHIQKIITLHPNATLYYNNIYSTTFFLTPFILSKQKNQILATRGMLLPQALGIKSLKKRIYLKLLKSLTELKKLTLQCSSEAEAEASRKIFSKATIKIIGNTPIKPNMSLPPKIKRKGKVIMVSRVHPIKNIHFLSEVAAFLEKPLNLDIIGPIEDLSYHQTLVKSFGQNTNLNVRFLGPLPPHEIDAIWSGYDLFLSSSLSENFGQSIFEAMAHGLPVIISTNTPWQDLGEKEVGRVLPFHADLWAQEIGYFLKLSNEKYLETQKKVWEYSYNFYVNQKYEEINTRLIHGS